MNTINKEDLIYLAGFLDGDGSIIAKLVFHKDYVKTRPYQISLTVQVTQKTTRKWFLEEIQGIIGEGNVNTRKSNEKIADYTLVGPSAVGKFLKQIQPYLRIKKKQANLAIRITEQLPHSKDPDKFYELCHLVDQISALNDSKNREITAEIVISRMKEALKEIVPVETEE
jgi:hypothetical protein